MIEHRNIRWRPGDPARLTTRVNFHPGQPGAMLVGAPRLLPSGTLVRVRDVQRTGRGRFRSDRVLVERHDGADPLRWAWLDPDSITRPEDFDA